MPPPSAPSYKALSPALCCLQGTGLTASEGRLLANALPTAHLWSALLTPHFLPYDQYPRYSRSAGHPTAEGAEPGAKEAAGPGF